MAFSCGVKEQRFVCSTSVQWSAEDWVLSSAQCWLVGLTELCSRCPLDLQSLLQRGELMGVLVQVTGQKLYFRCDAECT